MSIFHVSIQFAIVSLFVKGMSLRSMSGTAVLMMRVGGVDSPLLAFHVRMRTVLGWSGVIGEPTPSIVVLFARGRRERTSSSDSEGLRQRIK